MKKTYEQRQAEKAQAISILNRREKINLLAAKAMHVNPEDVPANPSNELHVVSMLWANLPDDEDPESALSQDLAQLSQMNMTVRQLAEMCWDLEEDAERVISYLQENGTNEDSITPFLEASPWTMESFRTQQL